MKYKWKIFTALPIIQHAQYLSKKLNSCCSVHSREHCTFISLIFLFNDFMYSSIYLSAVLIRIDTHEEPHRWFLQLVPTEAETPQTEFVPHHRVLMDFSNEDHLSISDIWWPAGDWLKTEQPVSLLFTSCHIIWHISWNQTDIISFDQFAEDTWQVHHLSYLTNVYLLEQGNITLFITQ